MHLTQYSLLAFLLVPTFAAPPLQRRSTTFNHGDIVGVRPAELEGKPRAGTKAVSIHPGVVLGTPHPVTGKFPVAMISKKLPNDPPQAPIQDFYHGSSLHGNIKLAPPKHIVNAKPWKNEKTGGRQSPVSPAGLQKLKEAMKPHEGWRSPSPPPHTPPPSPKGEQKQGQSVPEWRRRPAQVNAHASGSRIPVPVHAAPPHPANNAARKPNPPMPAHGNQLKQPAGQRPKSPQGSSSKIPVLASQPHQPANRSPSRPGSPPNRPAGTSSKPKDSGSNDKKGKQPVRGKREFMRRRAMRSLE